MNSNENHVNHMRIENMEAYLKAYKLFGGYICIRLWVTSKRIILYTFRGAKQKKICLKIIVYLKI